MKKLILFVSLAWAAMATCYAEWKPIGNKIMTPWAEKVNPQAPLPEYPRPQMVRSAWQNLNGLWNYAITPSSATEFNAEGQILVPFAVESALSGVGRMVGMDNALWYERTFTVPKNWKGKNIILHFGAVDWQSDVWVNGIHLGQHKGGYTPFEYDITKCLKKSGKQTLRVKVWDATDCSFQPRGKQVCQSSGIWYTPVTGIWQTVWMEPVAANHISSYYAVSDIDKKTLTVNVATSDVRTGDQIQVEVLEGGEGYNPETPSTKVIASAEVKDGKAVIALPTINTWSPDHPYLYGLRITLSNQGKVADKVEGYTAMRKISICRDNNDRKMSKRMALNNETLFQFGPLDQGWWPDGLYTAPTDEALKFDIVKTKEWGFNMIRKHIKVEPARWYFYCDQLGMLVWQDMPSIADHSGRAPQEYRPKDILRATINKWSHDSFTGGTDCVIPQMWKENFYKEWSEIINAIKSFQSIVVWVPFNEAWGQFDTKKAVELTRQLDNTRLINAASGGNFHHVGDIQDCHHYPQPAMNAYEGKFVNVLGEYGGIGYAVKGHLWQEDKNWGYNGLKKDGKEVLDQYEEFAELLKHYIICGTSAGVYTQTTDVEVEVNGLMTYDRKVIKIDSERLAKINKSVIASMPHTIVK